MPSRQTSDVFPIPPFPLRLKSVYSQGAEITGSSWAMVGAGPAGTSEARGSTTQAPTRLRGWGVSPTPSTCLRAWKNGFCTCGGKGCSLRWESRDGPLVFFGLSVLNFYRRRGGGSHSLLALVLSCASSSPTHAYSKDKGSGEWGRGEL